MNRMAIFGVLLVLLTAACSSDVRLVGARGEVLSVPGGAISDRSHSWWVRAAPSLDEDVTGVIIDVPAVALPRTGQFMVSERAIMLLYPHEPKESVGQMPPPGSPMEAASVAGILRVHFSNDVRTSSSWVLVGDEEDGARPLAYCSDQPLRGIVCSITTQVGGFSVDVQGRESLPASINEFNADIRDLLCSWAVGTLEWC